MRKMKNIFKIYIVSFLLTLLLLILIENNIYASSFKFNVTATKTILKPQESTTISMKISDIVDVNNLGINTVEATLEYDSNVLEVITPNDIKGKNNWTVTYNTEDKHFLVSNMIAGVKNEQEIGEITFKIKKNIQKTKTIIKFKDIKSNDGNNLMYEADKEIELIIGEDESNSKYTPIDKTQNINLNNTSSNPLPKAGNNKKVIVQFTILIVSLLATLFYINYKKLDK